MYSLLEPPLIEKKIESTWNVKKGIQKNTSIKMGNSHNAFSYEK